MLFISLHFSTTYHWDSVKWINWKIKLPQSKWQSDKATILHDSSKVKIVIYAWLKILLSLFLLELNISFFFCKYSFWQFMQPAWKCTCWHQNRRQLLAQWLTAASPLGNGRLQPVVSEREDAQPPTRFTLQSPHPPGHPMPLASARQLASVPFNFPTSGFREKSWLWELALGSSWLPPQRGLARITLSSTLWKEAV